MSFGLWAAALWLCPAVFDVQSLYLLVRLHRNVRGSEVSVR